MLRNHPPHDQSMVHEYEQPIITPIRHFQSKIHKMRNAHQNFMKRFYKLSTILNNMP